MRPRVIHNIVPLLLLLFHAASAAAEPRPIGDLSYEDRSYIALSSSTVASKNMMLKGTRLERHETPVLYAYTMKRREDIWTLIAKTSLTIDAIATLNGIDFIGVIREGVRVFLPDTLGVFFDSETSDPAALSERFGVGLENILPVEDPAEPGRTLLFVPEAELSFLERSYLTGVVFHAPIVGVRTSGYGDRIDPFVNERTFHGGVDISADEGKIVRASRWGTVVYAALENGYGNLVVLRHELGYYTFYGHLSEILVSPDEAVETGQALGKVGSSGKTTGPHLHFEIRRRGIQLNPENIPFFLEHG